MTTEINNLNNQLELGYKKPLKQLRCKSVWKDIPLQGCRIFIYIYFQFQVCGFVEYHVTAHTHS